MPPSISRTPDFSSQFSFPLEVREIGIPLYMAHQEVLVLNNAKARVQSDANCLLDQFYLFRPHPWGVLRLAAVVIATHAEEKIATFLCSKMNRKKLLFIFFGRNTLLHYADRLRGKSDSLALRNGKRNATCGNGRCCSLRFAADFPFVNNRCHS